MVRVRVFVDDISPALTTSIIVVSVTVWWVVLFLGDAVAVIKATPTPTAVTLPLPSTVTTSVLLLLKVSGP